MLNLKNDIINSVNIVTLNAKTELVQNYNSVSIVTLNANTLQNYTKKYLPYFPNNLVLK